MTLEGYRKTSNFAGVVFAFQGLHRIKVWIDPKKFSTVVKFNIVETFSIVEAFSIVE